MVSPNEQVQLQFSASIRRHGPPLLNRRGQNARPSVSRRFPSSNSRRQIDIRNGTRQTVVCALAALSSHRLPFLLRIFRLVLPYHANFHGNGLVPPRRRTGALRSLAAPPSHNVDRYSYLPHSSRPRFYRKREWR